MKDWIFDRLKENSTWRGIILLAGLLGAHFRPEEQEQIIATALAVIALINVFRRGTKPGGEFNPQAEIREARRP